MITFNLRPILVKIFKSSTSSALISNTLRIEWSTQPNFEYWTFFCMINKTRPQYIQQIMNSWKQKVYLFVSMVVKMGSIEVVAKSVIIVKKFIQLYSFSFIPSMEERVPLTNCANLKGTCPKCTRRTAIKMSTNRTTRAKKSTE